jgi:hypothetical protein
MKTAGPPTVSPWGNSNNRSVLRVSLTIGQALETAVDGVAADDAAIRRHETK